MTLAEQYIEKGRQEVLQASYLESKVESILIVLEERFGPIPAEISTAVSSIKDLSELRVLLRTAVLCADLNTFRASLQLP
ncbi:MAG: hypothetical protein JJT96_10095 [Opitutales bacterium]|nr:hypothetical protein [Opitutales bacterium]